MSVSLPAGIYRHYKGHHYLLLGIAQDANDEGREVVVYVGLEPQGAKNARRMSVRTLEDFRAVVNPETGETAEMWDGTSPGLVNRFTFVGAYLPLDGL